MNPFDEMNKAMRDRDTQFTKRELIAMHFMAALIQRGDSSSFGIDAEKAVKAADTLLETLRQKP